MFIYVYFVFMFMFILFHVYVYVYFILFYSFFLCVFLCMRFSAAPTEIFQSIFQATPDDDEQTVALKRKLLQRIVPTRDLTTSNKQDPVLDDKPTTSTTSPSTTVTASSASSISIPSRSEFKLANQPK